jgi:hypothetical protein
MATTLGLTLVALSSGAFARPFTFTPIEVPDATVTVALGINAAGHNVGYYEESVEPMRGHTTHTTTTG